MFEVSESVCSIEAHRQESCFEQCGIDLVDAAESHICWRDKLQRCIDRGREEDFSALAAITTEACGLESWLQGVGRVRYGHYQSFRRLAVDHAEFHRVAELILNRVKSRDSAAAEGLLKNEFSHATRRILMAISELNDALR